MKRAFANVRLLLILSAALFFLVFSVGCDYSSGGDGDDDTDDDDTADDDWEPVEPHREARGKFIIVWLAGTPYEMGHQHGELLHDEARAAVEWLGAGTIDLLIGLARTMGILDLAYANSYPDIVEECQGFVDATSDVGITMDFCILLNFGDVLVEFISEGMPEAKAAGPACSQVVAAHDATSDGRLYHARSLDWDKLDYLLDYPVIFVRQPSDGIPHAYIGFPGNLSPYSGMNAEGLSVASDEADPLDNGEQSRTGRSHVQMQAMLLKSAHSLDEAKAFIQSQEHMSTEITVVADGISKQAAVFEMTAKHLGIRELANGVVYATNHFVAPETVNADKDPVAESSQLRFDRLAQLADPEGEYTRYGELSPAVLVEILRDRVNPYTLDESPADEFDNDSSIATNGAIYQIVFDNEKLLFWVAAGGLPVPQQPFVCFSLGELLRYPDAAPCEPAIYE